MFCTRNDITNILAYKVQMKEKSNESDNSKDKFTLVSCSIVVVTIKAPATC